MADAAAVGAPGAADPYGAPLLPAGAGPGRGSDGWGKGGGRERGRGREGLDRGGDGEIGEEVLVERLGEAMVEVVRGGDEVIAEDDHAFEEGSEVFFSGGHLAGRQQFDGTQCCGKTEIRSASRLYSVDAAILILFIYLFFTRGRKCSATAQAHAFFNVSCIARRFDSSSQINILLDLDPTTNH